ncbi:MAG: peptidylprolyl isomerase [Thermodesulfobacteriota bacterium]
MLTLALGLSACSAGEKEKPTQNAIIARVDGRAITREALERSLKVLMHQGGGEEVVEEAGEDPAGESGDDGELGPAEMSELKKNILNELIEEELVLMEAEKEGIDVSIDELNGVISSMMENTEREEFYKGVIPLYGSAENWTREVRRRLLIGKVIEWVKSSVKETSEVAASKYYIRNAKKYKVPEQVHASMILVATEEEAGKVTERLAAGEPFAELAKEVSIGPAGVMGGDLGYFGRGEMPKEFEETVFKIPVSIPSEVVKTEYGFHIFFVHKRSKGRSLKFEKVKPEIKKRLRAEKAEEKLRQWLSTLKKDANIEILEEI